VNVVALSANGIERETITEVILDFSRAVIAKIKLRLVKVIRDEIVEPLKTRKQTSPGGLVEKVQQVKPRQVVVNV